MNKKSVIALLVVIAVLFFLSYSEYFTGFSVLFMMGDQGGRTDYDLAPVDTFVQCWDADPANLMDVKSICHAQFYEPGSRRLRGMNAVDYCLSGDEVVDYYCGSDFSCQELRRTCPEGYSCEIGRCVKESPALRIPSFVALKESFQRFF